MCYENVESEFFRIKDDVWCGRAVFILYLQRSCIHTKRLGVLVAVSTGYALFMRLAACFWLGKLMDTA